MTGKSHDLHLSRRERQIMDIVHQLKEATAAEVRDSMPDPPSYTTVRTHLRLLEGKGHLSHRQEGLRYVYSAVIPLEEVQNSALERVLKTFFEGSAEQAMASLLRLAGSKLSDEELDRLTDLVEQAKKRGR